MMGWKSPLGSNRQEVSGVARAIPGANRAMLHDGFSAMTHIHGYLRQYSQLEYVCNCNRSVHSFHLGITSEIKCEGGVVWLDAYILPPLISLTDHLECDCDMKHQQAILTVDQRIWSEKLRGASSIFVANVYISFDEARPVLNAAHAHAILMKEFSNRTYSDNGVTTSELCAGGFAGWMHASDVCVKHGCDIRHLFAVECEQDIADTYCGTWKNARQVHDIQDWPDDMLPSNFPLFVTDLQQGWWLSLVGDIMPDILFLSAPCPPWSSASTGKGLRSSEGWVTVAALVACVYLRPKLVAWEQVAAIDKHPHWGAIKFLIQKCGFKIIVSHKNNLLTLSPQNRERLLMLLIHTHVPCEDALIERFKFPTFKLQSLISFQAMQWDVSRFQQLVQIDSKALDKYLDEKLMPKSFDGKRTRVDMMSYRIKKPWESVGCIMASYTHQHELSLDLLRSKGLFGTLLQHGEHIRFLSPIECAMLMMPCHDTFIPFNQVLHMRVIGNAISSVHAAFLLGGALMILDKGVFPCNDPCSLVVQVMKERLHFGNSRIVEIDNGWILRKTSQLIHQRCECDELPISPTQNEPKFMRASITSGSWAIKGWIEGGMSFTVVMQAFGQEHQIGTQVKRTGDKLVIILPKPFIVPITKINWHETTTGAIMVMCKGTFVIVWRRHAPTIEALLRLIPQVTDIQTEGSCLSNVIGRAMLLHDKPPPICMLLPTGIDMSARWVRHLPSFKSQSGCITATMPRDLYQHFVCTMKAAGIDQMCAIWGWTICMSVENDNATQVDIFFRRVHCPVVLTTDNMFDLLTMWTMRLLLPPDREAFASGVHLCIRFHSSMVWEGYVERNWTFQEVNYPWMIAMNAFQKDCPIRAVVKGKWKHEDESMVDNEHDTSVRVQWILPTHGGGKDEIKFAAKNKLASVLLLRGVSFSDVADFVDIVTKNVSPGKLLHELSSVDKPSGWKNFSEWLSKMGHPIPQTDRHMENAVQKIQNAVRKRKDIQKQRVVASQINILPDHFRKDDGTPALILKTMIDAKSGVILLDPQDASAWINNPKPISQESLACIVIGHECPAEDTCKCRKISVPAVDGKGQPLLVAGCMHQLGTKDIIIPQDDMVTMPTEQSVIMSFTAYKDECDRDLWKAIIDNPVKVILQIVRKDFDQNFLSCGPWGRSWRCDKKSAGSDIANSFQFHARVKKEHFKTIMNLSGRGPIYMTPKSEDKGLLPGWAIVWMHSSKQDVFISMSKMPVDHAGLVRTDKGIGIRVKQDVFEQAFKFLRPSDKPPPSVAAKFLYKLQPLPAGMTSENIMEFTHSKGWTTRPLKALGSSAWLVASEKPAPQQWIGLNGTLVLVKAVEQAQQRDKPIVLAGRLETTQQNKSTEVNKGVDPWVVNSDPWQQYQPLSSHAGGKPLASGLQSHSVTDPSLAKRLQEQDDKIQSLQTSMQDIQKYQKHAEVNAKSYQQQLDGKLQSFRAEVGDQMTSLSSQFQASLQQALSKQDRQINAGFSELKSLFMQSRGCDEESLASKRLKGNKGKETPNEVKEFAMNSDEEMGASPLKTT